MAMVCSEESKPIIEPVWVRPKTAARMIDCGVTRFYELLNAGIFKQKIPVLDRSLAELVNPAAKFDAVIRNLRQDLPTTLDQLVSRLTNQLGGAASPSLRAVAIMNRV